MESLSNLAKRDYEQRGQGIQDSVGPSMFRRRGLGPKPAERRCDQGSGASAPPRCRCAGLIRSSGLAARRCLPLSDPNRYRYPPIGFQEAARLHDVRAKLGLPILVDSHVLVRLEDPHLAQDLAAGTITSSPQTRCWVSLRALTTVVANAGRSELNEVRRSSTERPLKDAQRLRRINLHSLLRIAFWPLRGAPAKRPAACPRHELRGAVDGNLESGKELTHSPVAQASEAFDEKADRDAFDRVEVDGRPPRDRVFAGFKHHFAGQTPDGRRARRDERPSQPRDSGVTRQHDHRAPPDPWGLAPPDLAPGRERAHEPAAASPKEAKSPHSSASSRGCAS